MRISSPRFIAYRSIATRNASPLSWHKYLPKSFVVENHRVSFVSPHSNVAWRTVSSSRSMISGGYIVNIDSSHDNIETALISSRNVILFLNVPRYSPRRRRGTIPLDCAGESRIPALLCYEIVSVIGISLCPFLLPTTVPRSVKSLLFRVASLSTLYDR